MKLTAKSSVLKTEDFYIPVRPELAVAPLFMGSKDNEGSTRSPRTKFDFDFSAHAL